MKLQNKLFFFCRPAICVPAFFVGLAWLGTPRTSAAPPQAISAAPIPQTGEPAAQEMVSFTKALETLSRRFNVAFVVEDEPHDESIPASVLSQVLTKNTEGAGSDEEAAQNAVKTVAKAFDYFPERRGAVFLLYKRFTKFPGELPSVTYEECLLMERDTMRAVRALNPNIPEPSGSDVPLAAPLMKSLTQDQLAAMFNGSTNIGNTVNGKPRRGVLMNGTPVEGRTQKSSRGEVQIGLPIRSLSPAQQNEVRKIAAYYFIQRPFGTSEGESTLQLMAKPGVKFRFERTQHEGTPAMWTLGCVAPPAVSKGKNVSEGKKVWSTLWHYYDPAEGNVQHPSAYYEAFSQHYYVVGIFPGFAPDQYYGNAEQIAAVYKKAEIRTKEEDAAGKAGLEEARRRRERGVSQTLEQAAKKLNARSMTGKKVRVAVDPALAFKRITLVGTDTVDNASVWTVVARLYGLTTREAADGSVLLTRYRVKVAQTFADVPEALAHIAPLPYLHFPTDHITTRDAAHNMTSYTTMVEAAYKEAQLRFFALAKQKAALSPEREFTLQDLGEEGRQYLAIWMTISDAPNLANRGAALPIYISEFDKQVLIGGLYIGPNEETYFSFGFAKEDNPGALIQGPGFGSVKYKH